MGVLSNFQNCFTKPSYSNFLLMITGWITCQGRHSISRVIQAAGEQARDKHHSVFYRFLSRGKWSTDALGKVVYSLLSPWLPTRIVVILDDTLSHKSGPHIFGACMHYDASQSTYGRSASGERKAFFAFGHNWVVLALWIPLPWNQDRGLAVPILFRLYRSKKRCPKAQYRKRTLLALDLVEVLSNWLPADRTMLLVGDAEYACRNVVRNLPERIIFVGPMCMDAALFDRPGTQEGPGRKRLKGSRLPSPEQLARCRSTPWEDVNLTIYGRSVAIRIKSQVCMWYTVAGVRQIRMVLTRDPTGSIKDRAYFSTDDTASSTEVLVQFARRWEIEVAFRNTKQGMGLQDPQNGWWRRSSSETKPRKKAGPNPRGRRGEVAINHTLALAFAAYAVVIIWYAKHGNRVMDIEEVRRDAPWYLHKSHSSVQDMIAAVRREVWAARFSAHPVFKGVCPNIRALLPHWLVAA
jgi:hypothetical protein